jgi:hypothetical protein
MSQRSKQERLDQPRANIDGSTSRHVIKIKTPVGSPAAQVKPGKRPKPDA